MADVDRIVVVGASAGGVEASLYLAEHLPADFTAPVFITIRFPADAESMLAAILARRSALHVRPPDDGEEICPGRIYIARPGSHLLITRGRIRLGRGPTENGNRPAIDPMFRSAALAYGPRVIGVVLTGNLDDGTAGLRAIKRRGGIAVAQNPDDAVFRSMPASAIEHVPVDHIVALSDLPGLLQQLVAEPLPSALAEASHMSDDRSETEFAAFDREAIENADAHPGTPSPFGCPDCGGVLWETRDGDLVRYRCRIGHAWTADGLAFEQQSSLEEALWTALRALEESAQLNEQLAGRIARRGHPRLQERFLARSESLRAKAAIIRQVLLDSGTQPRD